MYITFPRLRLRISLFALPAALCMLYTEGMMPFVIMLSSALLHEIGHLAALRLCGRSVRRVDILPMGALIVVPEGIPNVQELRIALSGPLASLLAALICSGAFSVIRSTPLIFAALVNLSLGLFNILPIKKLDGGKALASYLAERTDEEKSARICTLADLMAKMLFTAIAAASVCVNSQNLGILLLTAVLISQIFK